MAQFPEVVQTRVSAGTTSALEQLARAEGKKPGDIVRESIAARLNATRSSVTREAA